jgi:hypothetical protein
VAAAVYVPVLPSLPIKLLTKPKVTDTMNIMPRATSTTVSNRINSLLRRVDKGEWVGDHWEAHRCLVAALGLLDSPELLTEEERIWLTGVTVWVCESIDDAAMLE